MASFTDNPAGQQFAEYTPPVNLQLYAGIMAKRQEEYERGYEKASGYLDTIAGIPTTNEDERVYLEGKVTELNKQANQFAGADFTKSHDLSILTR